MKSNEKYKFKLHYEIDRINSNTKEDQSTSWVFRDNTNADIGIDSQQYNGEGVKSNSSRLSEKCHS